MQHRVGVAIQPAGVEQRQHGEQHRRWRDIGRAAEIDAIPERHAVGDDGALRLARGARGVHDGRDVIERDGFGLVERFCRRDRRLVGAIGPQQQRRSDLAEACHRQRDLGEVGIVDHQDGRGVADDVVQLGDGEAGVQRQEHRAEPAARELHFQRIGRVQRQHGDPVAALDPGPRADARRAGKCGHRIARRKTCVRWRGRRPPSCPACGGRNARSSHSGEPAKRPPCPAVLRRLFLEGISIADEG